MSFFASTASQPTSNAHLMQAHAGRAWSAPPTAAAVRVFVVHGVSIYRRGLCAVLSGERDLHCVGEAESITQAASAPLHEEPQVVLLNLSASDATLASEIQRLAARWPRARVVVLSGEPDAGRTRRALSAGATRVVGEAATAFDLAGEIHAAARGQRTPAPAVDSAAELGSDLTPRERELITLMAQGLSNSDISAQLRIALPTVKFHVTNILVKLDAVNRTAAVLTALRHKIVAFA